MRKFLIAAAAVLSLGSAALAADKGGPNATVADLIRMNEAPTTLSRCYVETAVAGTFLAAGDRQAHGSLGGGCDLTINTIMLGVGLRADFGDTTAAAITAKLGYAINPHVTLYGLAEWRTVEFKFAQSGALHLGAGVETSLANIVKGLSLFGEASTAVDKFGSRATKDDVSTRAGLRFRF